MCVVVWRVEEFSGTLADLEARFGSEQACWDYLLKLRWPEGFVCPRCSGRTAWTTTRHLLVCAGCQHQASVTAGTIFQDTRKPLTLWCTTSTSSRSASTDELPEP